MKQMTHLACITGLMALATPALASESGPTLGLRAAYGMPFGSAGDGAEMADLTWGAVPIQLDLGYRFTERWGVGAYFSYGYVGVASQAKDALGAAGATDVGGHAEMRVGLQAIYRLVSGGKLVPWAGVGFGYEWTRYAAADVTTAQGDDELEVGLGGLEGSLQIGSDWQLAPSFSIGPYVSLHAGQYRAHLATVEAAGAANAPVGDRTLHAWTHFGLQGSFSL